MGSGVVKKVTLLNYDLNRRLAYYESSAEV